MNLGRIYTPLPPISSRASNISQDDDEDGDEDDEEDNDVSGLDDEELHKKAKLSLWKLVKAQKLNDSSYPFIYTLQAILYECFDERERCSRLATYLTSLNFVKITQKLLKNHFIEAYTSKERDKLWASLHALMTIMWSFSDKSMEFCIEMHKTKFYVDLLHLLKSPFLSPEKMGEDNPFSTVQPIVGSLHNLVQKIPASWEDMRSASAVEILQPYRECSNQMISSVSLMVQAYIINENDNEKINSGLEIFKFLILILDTTIKDETFYTMKFSVIEVIEVLNKLAVNDSNKKRIIEAGGLPYYVILMKGGPNWGNDVIAEAARGLWILGFKCKDDIINECDCIDTLKSLLKHGDPAVKEKAEGALWILEKQDKITNKLKEALSKNNLSANSASKTAVSEAATTAAAKDSGHIFISYQWDSKTTVLKVRDRLKNAGFKTWLDEDDMSGSVLEAMAMAVEKAHTVIICLSQKYKDSPNCRTEAEYTFRLRKKVIPLRLQSGYYPDGWLGILVGSKLVFDVSQQNRYEDSLKHLIKELSLGLEESGEIVPKVQPVQKTEVETVGTANESVCSDNNNNSSSSNNNNETTTTTITTNNNNSNNNTNSTANSTIYKNWNIQDVEKWLTEKKFKDAKKIFDKFDGRHLIEFSRMLREAPESFFSFLLKREIPMRDILTISSSLREISQ